MSLVHKKYSRFINKKKLYLHNLKRKNSKRIHTLQKRKTNKFKRDWKFKILTRFFIIRKFLFKNSPLRIGKKLSQIIKSLLILYHNRWNKRKTYLQLSTGRCLLNSINLLLLKLISQNLTKLKSNLNFLIKTVQRRLKLKWKTFSGSRKSNKSLYFKANLSLIILSKLFKSPKNFRNLTSALLKSVKRILKLSVIPAVNLFTVV